MRLAEHAARMRGKCIGIYWGNMKEGALRRISGGLKCNIKMAYKEI